ncbi:MAG: SDR family oxidoreductase [Bacteroidales bacterium]|jgi:NAD(P)-dependent dehydrogenase (short-subunit alcohol dehydrogenase family)|nr:SDR family oxidoreductase [Bacteroidales bacterium]NLM92077.1 SDR family oxidoreductase [Bacteroidales bacterium]
MKHILITGGSSGIGLAIAKKLMEEGNRKVISLSRSQEKIERALFTHPEMEGEVDFITGDVSKAGDCQKVAGYLKDRYGKLDGLVNNAGMLTAGGIHDIDYELWKANLDINLNAPYLLTQMMLPLLKASGNASVVNISSVASRIPGRSIAYSVSKAGLDMITEFLAGELGPYQIRVNAVNPGLVETPLHLDSKVVDDESMYREMLAKSAGKYPIGRIGKPEDIAQMVCFLLSEKASWVTGSIIRVDGGSSVFNEILKRKNR